MNPIGQEPIQDVAPPHDNLGNPEQYANIAMRQAPNTPAAAPTANPIATGPTPKPAPPPRTPAPKKDSLDKVLKDVNKEVKQATQKPWQPSKPVIEISLAVIVALALSGAAFYAFKSK